LAEKKSAAKSATTSVAVKLKSAPPAAAKKAPPAAAPRPAASKPAAAKPAPIPPAPVKKVVRVAPARPLSRPIPVGPPRTFTPVAAVPSSQWGPFREKLERKRQEILDMYARDLRSGQEASDDNTDDLVDRANNAISRELMFSLSDGERQLLLQVEDALTRMTSGAYGRCVHCGQPIAAPRLEALPWAKYCIDCQELQEKGLLEDA
jgi:DnaK suppressor protein